MMIDDDDEQNWCSFIRLSTSSSSAALSCCPWRPPKIQPTHPKNTQRENSRFSAIYLYLGGFIRVLIWGRGKDSGVERERQSTICTVLSPEILAYLTKIRLIKALRCRFVTSNCSGHRTTDVLANDFWVFIFRVGLSCLHSSCRHM